MAESRSPAAESRSLRAGRRLYVPTIVIAGLAAWLSYRGWTALAQTGVARSFDAGRYNLAGPVVLGFVLTVCVLEQVFPASAARCWPAGTCSTSATRCSTPCS
jgi:hypothetical protein